MPKLKTSMGFDKETIDNLAKLKIFSINDFIDADVDDLYELADLPVKKALELKRNLIAQHSAQITDGWSLFMKSLQAANVLPTIIKSLDILLEGGLHVGSILELCGLCGSGKSQLCMTIAANWVCKLNMEVLFIDTKGDISGSRLSELVKHTNCDDKNIDELLEKIDIIRVKDIHETMSALENLRSNLAKGKSKLYKLLIIDSITSLYLPFVGLKDNPGVRYTNCFASALKEVITEFQIAAIVTNLGSNYMEQEEGTDLENRGEAELKPLLGKYWRHVPNTRLSVNKVNTSDRQMQVMKSTHLPLHESCIITMTDWGGYI